MQKFIVDDAFWKIFPDARIAVLSLKDVDETARLSDEEMKEIAALLDEAGRGAAEGRAGDLRRRTGRLPGRRTQD